MVHRYYTLEYNEHTEMQDYNKEIVYGKTKLAQVMFMKYLSMTGPSSISFLAFHPGVLRTRILADYVGTDLNLLTMGEDPRKGGQRLAFLVTAEEVSELSGTYFENNVPAIPAPQTNDKEELTRLFHYTTDLLKPYFKHYLPSFLNQDA
jgi:NAD(P)-dependent dehydrogenase (short-subunit alcohol dehydrogenase family)